MTAVKTDNVTREREKERERASNILRGIVGKIAPQRRVKNVLGLRFLFTDQVNYFFFTMSPYKSSNFDFETK